MKYNSKYERNYKPLKKIITCTNSSNYKYCKCYFVVYSSGQVSNY